MPDQAFPVSMKDRVQEYGLSKRQFVAALILSGIFAQGDMRAIDPQEAADVALQAADALLKKSTRVP